MSGTGHLSLKQGTPCIVHLRNGGKFIAKFKERKARFVVLYRDVGNNWAEYSIPTKDIRTIGVYKPTH